MKEWLRECLARKFAAGEHKHKGTDDDWADWDVDRLWEELAAELMDAWNYAQEIIRRTVVNRLIASAIRDAIENLLERIGENSCRRAVHQKEEQ